MQIGVKSLAKLVADFSGILLPSVAQIVAEYAKPRHNHHLPYDQKADTAFLDSMVGAARTKKTEQLPEFYKVQVKIAVDKGYVDSIHYCVQQNVSVAVIFNTMAMKLRHDHLEMMEFLMMLNSDKCREAINKDMDILVWIIVNVNTVSPHNAAMRMPQEYLVKKALEILLPCYFAKLNQPSNQGTLLMTAACCNSEPLVAYLIQLGADPLVQSTPEVQNTLERICCPSTHIQQLDTINSKICWRLLEAIALQDNNAEIARAMRSKAGVPQNIQVVLSEYIQIRTSDKWKSYTAILDGPTSWTEKLSAIFDMEKEYLATTCSRLTDSPQNFRRNLAYPKTCTQLLEELTTLEDIFLWDKQTFDIMIFTIKAYLIDAVRRENQQKFSPQAASASAMQLRA